MSFVPSFKLYASNGTDLVYTFDDVIEIIGWPTDNPDYVEHTNLRSQGSIIIPGGDKAYNIIIRGVLRSTDYENLTIAMLALRDTIDNNTNYVLKLDKSSTTTDDINVMRIQPITFEGPAKRTKWQFYSVPLLANSWSS